MSATYSPAPEVERLAQDLIQQYHPHLHPGRFEQDVRIEYLFTDEPKRKNGKTVLGTARKISSMAAFLAGQEEPEDRTGEPFFVICIYSGWFNSQHDQDKKRALIDHELCHLGVTELMDDFGNFAGLKLSLRAHDVEEFGSVVERWGLWYRDLQEFHGWMQLSLFDRDSVSNITPLKRTATG